MTEIEKGKLYGGDRTILNEKLGLIAESDLEKYKGKVGLKDPNMDFAKLDADELDILV